MENTNYVATFSLTQAGLDGEVTPSLEFSPLVNPVDEEAPAIYEYMANLALNFLRQVNIIDEHNELVEPGGLDDVVLNVKVPETKH